MPRTTPKPRPTSQFEVVTVGEVDPYALTAARLVLLGIDPAEARRRARSLKRDRAAQSEGEKVA